MPDVCMQEDIGMGACGGPEFRFLEKKNIVFQTAKYKGEKIPRSI